MRDKTKRPTIYREFTLAAVLLGLLQGVLLNVAFVYIALKLGFSIGGSSIASILGYVFLRLVLGKGTIVENNINQTIASGINSTGTGVVFVLPAVFLLSQQNSIPFLPLLIAGLGGAVLGVILIIPLRKQLIEQDRLRFPTGVAVAAIIRTGPAGLHKAKLLGIGFLIASSWKLLLLSGWLSMPGLIDLEFEELHFDFGVLPAYVAPMLSLSLLNFAAGMLSGRAGLPFFIGGLLAWWIISPATVSLGWIPAELSGVAQTDYIYGEILRPLGIGVLIGAALIEVVLNYPSIKQAIHALAAATQHQTGLDREELPVGVLIIGAIAALLFFFFALWSTPGIALWQALLAALLGTLWMGLAGLIVAEATGLTDVSPISGMALISITMMMLLLNGNLLAAMMVTIGVAIAIGQSADMMQDLKTGFMVGSRPFWQQVAQLATSWIGVLVAFATLYVLWHSGAGGAHGFGEGTSLPAPQASALTEVINAVQTHSIPTEKFILGALVGIVLGFAPIAGLGILGGLAMYLPFSITLGYGLGCLTQMWVVRRKGLAFAEHQLVPLAAGLIIGEALTGVGAAIYALAMT
ncbi:OPT/YSL family transporter [Candidatus Venteria ishoeyi]|uniref:OPT/YSL family transporter n=1 Tax=Candidatus Venteria ishoeyi TaxID=1899563 RepID=UPI0025A52D08|nr:OPT/YSL family transporter [Candidatus Venteria ishoeyi]MDM8548324.1 OPT/YSL family transporter [Candidatus Venteria ishoeyi]